MNLSYQKIKDFDQKLVTFLKTNLSDNLFTWNNTLVNRKIKFVGVIN
jgi:hypothetical protein